VARGLFSNDVCARVCILNPSDTAFMIKKWQCLGNAEAIHLACRDCGDVCMCLADGNVQPQVQNRGLDADTVRLCQPVDESRAARAEVVSEEDGRGIAVQMVASRDVRRNCPGTLVPRMCVNVTVGHFYVCA
jgi:hypothetical protein